MRSGKRSLVTALAMSLFMMGPVWALTLDYWTSADALVEVGWHDYLDYYWDSNEDHDAAENGQAYASALYDKIQDAGEVAISGLADAFIEPNETILAGTISGYYEFGAGWDLMDYFFQDANCWAEGQLVIAEFPLGAPCRLQIDISLPTNTWTGLWGWHVEVESSLDYFVAGRYSGGGYGSLSGTIDAYAGEQIYVFLGNAGQGYADHDTGDELGHGTITVNAALKAIPHVADLSADGSVNFEDFGHFSVQWQQQGCADPNTNWCEQADLDQSGQVDANDLGAFTQYWLLLPDPNNVL